MSQPERKPPPNLFQPGQKPPPRTGKARGGLAKSTRTLVGDDGMALAELWWSIANDPLRRDSDRLEASRLLADRGWGKSASFTPQEGDPLGIDGVQEAADEFRRNVLRLAPADDEGDTAPAGGSRVNSES